MVPDSAPRQDTDTPVVRPKPGQTRLARLARSV